MTKKIPIIPLFDKVVVVPKELDGKTASGLYIPETTNKEKPGQGKIVAVGSGKVGEDGKIQPMSLSVGQEVLFSRYSPEEIEFDGQKYLIVAESSVLAIIENK